MTKKESKFIKAMKKAVRGSAGAIKTATKVAKKGAK